MVKFRSAFSRTYKSFSPIGTHIQDVFELRKVDGIEKPVKVGETDLNEFIQLQLPDTLVYNILQKYLNGNDSVLNRTVGQFCDVTNFPSTLAEAQKILHNVNAQFESLPKDIKAKFDNSVSVYVDSIAKGGVSKFNEVFNLNVSVPVDAAENDEVKKVGVDNE